MKSEIRNPKSECSGFGFLLMATGYQSTGLSSNQVTNRNNRIARKPSLAPLRLTGVSGTERLAIPNICQAVRPRSGSTFLPDAAPISNCRPMVQPLQVI
jgi:hypothetical protein